DPLPLASVTAGETVYDLSEVTRPYLLHAAMRHFFANGGGACYVVSTGSYDDPMSPEAMLKALEALEKCSEATLVVIPETARLRHGESAAIQDAMLAHCAQMGDRFAILDIPGGHLPEVSPLGDPVATFRTAIGIENLSYGAAYYPWLETHIHDPRNFSFRNFSNGGRNALIDLLTASLRVGGAEADAQVFTQIKRIAPGVVEAEVRDAPDDWMADIVRHYDEAVAEGVVTADDAARLVADAKDAQIAMLVAKETEEIDRTLRATVPAYKDVMVAIGKRQNLIPPAAAMAGLYTMVDNTRGVWKAPANVSVSGVVEPAVAVGHEQQENLNVSTTGKSINAIRPFVGEGTLVWGARTLDGNSLDWRYINVRRTILMIEESIRLATKAYVFEPNTANTWITIKSMIENFLTSVWKQGGLAGAMPEDAFSVHAGLGETMTPVDILEGIMRVTVLVAVVRPAEFIEITFQQQMQKS
ncbi:MAG: phage tail sheath C-terminal domain-containing protein, partial [Pseudomonadota bacterium]